MTHVTCRLTAKNWDQLRNPTLGNRVLATFLIILLCSRRRVRAFSDTAIRPSFDRLSVPWRSCPRSAAALGYRHAGCLQLSRVRTAYPSAGGRRSAASRTAIGGGISSRRPRGDNLLKLVVGLYLLVHVIGPRLVDSGMPTFFVYFIRPKSFTSR